MKKRTYELNLNWIIQAKTLLGDSSEFINQPAFFNRLAGNNELKSQILSGLSAKEIRASWKPGIDNFKKIMSLNHKFNEAVITEISKNSLSTYNRLINTTQKHMNGRIADVLLYLSDEIYQAREFKLTLSKQDIAELSGMTKDSAVKVLRSFIQEGIITNKSGIIEICDYNILTRISQIG